MREHRYKHGVVAFGAIANHFAMLLIQQFLDDESLFSLTYTNKRIYSKMTQRTTKQRNTINPLLCQTDERASRSEPPDQLFYAGNEIQYGQCCDHTGLLRGNGLQAIFFSV